MTRGDDGETEGLETDCVDHRIGVAAAGDRTALDLDHPFRPTLGDGVDDVLHRRPRRGIDQQGHSVASCIAVDRGPPGRPHDSGARVFEQARATEASAEVTGPADDTHHGDGGRRSSGGIVALAGDVELVDPERGHDQLVPELHAVATGELLVDDRLISRHRVGGTAAHDDRCAELRDCSRIHRDGHQHAGRGVRDRSPEPR